MTNQSPTLHPSRRVVLCSAISGILFCSTQITITKAATLDIQFTGVDLRYDGTTSILHDLGDPALAGGTDTSKADDLLNMDFLVDGSSVGSLGADIYLDLEIPEVIDLPLAGGSVTTDGSPSGVLELLMPGIGLSLALGEAEVVYLPALGGSVNFVFAGAIATISAQSLPHDLLIGDPVSVSFSTQLVAGTLSHDGTYVTGFDSRGTGEVHGTVTFIPIPEPTSLCLTGLAIGLFTVYRRRRS